MFFSLELCFKQPQVRDTKKTTPLCGIGRFIDSLHPPPLPPPCRELIRTMSRLGAKKTGWFSGNRCSFWNEPFMGFPRKPQGIFNTRSSSHSQPVALASQAPYHGSRTWALLEDQEDPTPMFYPCLRIVIRFGESWIFAQMTQAGFNWLPQKGIKGIKRPVCANLSGANGGRLDRACDSLEA